MNKSVWRLNTGKGVPSDLGERYVYFDGSFGQVSYVDTFNDVLWPLESEMFWSDIYAYETNRTKPAKYR